MYKIQEKFLLQATSSIVNYKFLTFRKTLILLDTPQFIKVFPSFCILIYFNMFLKICLIIVNACIKEIFLGRHLAWRPHNPLIAYNDEGSLYPPFFYFASFFQELYFTFLFVSFLRLFLNVCLH